MGLPHSRAAPCAGNVRPGRTPLTFNEGGSGIGRVDESRRRAWIRQALTVDDVPVPELPDGQLLVKVVASGMFHTDLHAASGDWPVKPTLPFIPGHEGVGNGGRPAPDS
jgi:hypothetical protein